jgi:hypothetical protein
VPRSGSCSAPHTNARAPLGEVYEPSQKDPARAPLGAPTLGVRKHAKSPSNQDPRTLLINTPEWSMIVNLLGMDRGGDIRCASDNNPSASTLTIAPLSRECIRCHRSSRRSIHSDAARHAHALLDATAACVESLANLPAWPTITRGCQRLSESHPLLLKDESHLPDRHRAALGPHFEQLGFHC